MNKGNVFQGKFLSVVCLPTLMKVCSCNKFKITRDWKLISFTFLFTEEITASFRRFGPVNVDSNLLIERIEELIQWYIHYNVETS